MKVILTILVIVFIFFMFKQHKWLGFYYPDGCLVCEENYIFSPEFKTKDQCFDWADDLKMKRNNPKDLFECGRDCKLKDSGMYVCEETVD